jgi:hypothetical protein
MPTECMQDSLDFGTVEGRRVEGAFDGGAITSDGGALLLGGTDKAIGLIRTDNPSVSTGQPRVFGERECPAVSTTAVTHDTGAGDISSQTFTAAIPSARV